MNGARYVMGLTRIDFPSTVCGDRERQKMFEGFWDFLLNLSQLGYEMSARDTPLEFDSDDNLGLSDGSPIFSCFANASLNCD